MYKYIYGPVSSWRLGCSLGIDPLSQPQRLCTFDCVYCQLSHSGRYSTERANYIDTGALVSELKSVKDKGFDYITISGSGEPTLAKNLGDIIENIKRIRREPIAVLTNSSLLTNKTVCKDLMSVDFVIAKLDAVCEESFDLVNRPAKGIIFDEVLDGILNFREAYKGRLGLQIMFIHKNIKFAKQLADLARRIKPHQVQINTPLRPSSVKPLTKIELKSALGFFDGLDNICVYDIIPKKIIPLNCSDLKGRRLSKE